MSPNHPLQKNTKLNRWQVYHSLIDPESDSREVWEWCWQTFGHPGTHPETGVKNSWDYRGGWIYFYDEKCVTLYTLRWS